MTWLHPTRKKKINLLTTLYSQCLNQLALFFMNESYFLIDYLRGKSRRITLDHYCRALVRDISFHRLIYISNSNIACIEKTRMDQRCFYKLCKLLNTIGRLVLTKDIGVEVVIFLHILSRDAKKKWVKQSR